MLGADHTHAADLGFADLQIDDAVIDLLLRQLDKHRLIATRLVDLLQRIARAFDIVQGLLRAKERVHRLLDRRRIEHGIAAHEVLVDVHLARRGLIALLGPHRLRQDAQRQAAQRQR